MPLAERQVVDPAKHEVVTQVIVRGRSIRRKVQPVLNSFAWLRAAVRGGLVVDGLRPGIGTQEVEAVSHSLLDLDLRGLVTGIAPGAGDFDGRELRKGHPVLRIARARRG